MVFPLSLDRELEVRESIAFVYSVTVENKDLLFVFLFRLIYLSVLCEESHLKHWAGGSHAPSVSFLGGGCPPPCLHGSYVTVFNVSQAHLHRVLGRIPASS